MSTIPTTAAAAAETLETTLATEAALDIESIKELLDGFDPAALLPELAEIFSGVAVMCRWAILVGPAVLLVLGIAYLLLSPKEANYYFGYRCYFGMGSVEAWRYTQRLAGMVLGGLGLVLLVIALFTGSGFAAMAPDEVVWKAFSCLGWQAVLTVLANAAISLIAFLKFDRKGDLRKK